MLHIYKNIEELNTGLANWITELISKTLEVKEHFTLVLSGGSTPKKLYETLASEPYREKIKWERLIIFWGDERMVPFDDEQNNARMAYKALLEKVSIPEKQIHKMWTDVPPEKSAEHYNKILQQYFESKSTFFDLVLLGMGDDGHTLSLFPDSEILTDDTSWVRAINTKKGERITLMPFPVNNSGVVVFLITGTAKAKVLKEVIEGHNNSYPAQLIKPVNGELHWFTDAEAATYLSH